MKEKRRFPTLVKIIGVLSILIGSGITIWLTQDYLATEQHSYTAGLTYARQQADAIKTTIISWRRRFSGRSIWVSGLLSHFTPSIRKKQPNR